MAKADRAGNEKWYRGRSRNVRRETQRVEKKERQRVAQAEEKKRRTGEYTLVV